MTLCAFGMLLGTICYPEIEKIEQIDIFHEIAVKDPYRTLENLDLEETQIWVQKQNELTFEYLQGLPERKIIEQKLYEFWNFEKYSHFSRAGDKSFFFKNSGLQNQSVLYVTSDLTNESEILLDPNIFSEDGNVSVFNYFPSPDGKKVAYVISKQGSDQKEILIRDVKSKKDLNDRLQPIKYSSMAWSLDSKGFYYCYCDQSFQRICYHDLGTNQKSDLVIYEQTDYPECFFKIVISDDGQFLILSVYSNSSYKNQIFYKNLVTQDPFQELLIPNKESYQFLGNNKDHFWFRTTCDAPFGRIISIDLKNPDVYSWKEIIPQFHFENLIDAKIIHNRFILHYLEQAQSKILIFKLDGTYETKIEIPPFATVTGLSGNRLDKEVFITFSGFCIPPTIFRYDIENKECKLFYRASLPALENYQTKRVIYESKDRTKISMFLVFKKDLNFDGNHPVLLHGYGGFNIPLTPQFSPSILAWLEMGGIYAVPNLRGGGEYGCNWHEAGKLKNKRKVFDDFIAAAEFLIRKNLSKPSKIAIEGSGNGGLLVAACLNQRPELFGAAVSSDGVMDMLRYPKFTIGQTWMVEYGSPDILEDFLNLLSYSPIHNIKSENIYPPVLVVTSEYNNQIVPSHSYKYVASLQETQGRNGPIILYNKNKERVIEEIADKWAFLGLHLKMFEQKVQH